ncbi:MAG: exodeoxyribonuclease VII large subunit [Verrucomicrobiota bacterium]
MSFLGEFGMDKPKSVGEYTREIKQLLESRIEPCWVKGEVSNFRRQASGHLYFSLKDREAQLPAVMFRGNAGRLDFEIDNGLEVMAFGELSVYEPHGRYQLIVRAMQEAGAGRLHLEFERLKKKLQNEGLFDGDRKQALPQMPLKVAFVTSPTGAAVQDFIRILKRRDWPGALTVIPAKVQGKGAAEEIVEGLKLAERLGGFDVIVCGRGGGSLEDLWCFNEEAVARQIAVMEAPVVSAVGHEIDFTLSDFVADTRAETPSAAAELLSSATLAQIERLKRAAEGLDENLDYWIRRNREIVDGIALRLRSVSPVTRIEKAFLKLDDLSSRIDAVADVGLAAKKERLLELSAHYAKRDPDHRLRLLNERLVALAQRIERGWVQNFSLMDQRLESLAGELRLISPQATLERGYAMALGKEGKPIRSEKEVPDDGEFETVLRDGRFRTRRLGA